MVFWAQNINASRNIIPCGASRTPAWLHFFVSGAIKLPTATVVIVFIVADWTVELAKYVKSMLKLLSFGTCDVHPSKSFVNKLMDWINWAQANLPMSEIISYIARVLISALQSQTHQPLTPSNGIKVQCEIAHENKREKNRKRWEPLSSSYHLIRITWIDD